MFNRIVFLIGFVFVFFAECSDSKAAFAKDVEKCVNGESNINMSKILDKLYNSKDGYTIVPSYYENIDKEKLPGQLCVIESFIKGESFIPLLSSVFVADNEEEIKKEREEFKSYVDKNTFNKYFKDITADDYFNISSVWKDVLGLLDRESGRARFVEKYITTPDVACSLTLDGIMLMLDKDLNPTGLDATKSAAAKDLAKWHFGRAMLIEQCAELE